MANIQKNTGKWQENFVRLIDITADAQVFCEENGEDTTPNEALKAYYRSNTGASEFKTFKQWKLENKKVQKGSKGFLFWSRPLNKIKEEREKAKGTFKPPKPGEEEKKENTNFSFCFLFSDLQVKDEE